MKKFSKKVSFLTKILMIIGLFISDLAPLKMVFAYEKNESLVISNNNDILNIAYSEENAYESFNVVVKEKYVYLDGTEENNLKTYDNVPASDINGKGLNHNGLLLDVKFDGEYTAEVLLYGNITKIIEEEGEISTEEVTKEENLEVIEESIPEDDTTLENVEVIPEEAPVETETITELVATNDYTFSKKFDSGIRARIFNGTEEVNGSVLNGYVLRSNILSGGLAPTYKYTYLDTEYTGVELISLDIDEEINLEGHLYGEHTIEREIRINGETLEEELVYTENVDVMYGNYNDNAIELNNTVKELGKDSIYEFESYSKDSTLYVYPDLENGSARKVSDLFNILNTLYSSNELVSYSIKNGSNEVVFDPENDIAITNDIVITVTCGDLEITYKVICFADTDGDGIVTKNDLVTLINDLVDDSTSNTEDVTDDGKVNLKDAIYLYELLTTKSEVTLGEKTGEVETYLVVESEDIVSGDTFTVSYGLTLSEDEVNGISGKVKYDTNLFELVSVTNKTDWAGSNKNGKFIYIGSPLALGTEVTTEVVNEDETVSEVTSREEKSYVVLTFKFRAKKAGTGNISITDNEYIDGVNTLNFTGSTSTSVTVNAAANNELSKLIINGTEITLTDNVLDYTLDVGSDVTNVSVEAITEDENASISAIVNPEELAYGDNTITISVEAENGDIKIYTVNVIRAAAEEPTEDEPKEEEKVVPVVKNNTNNNKNNNKKENREDIPEVTPDEPSEPSKEKEDDGKLSRIIIIILILLVIAGLIYLIFKDDEDEETKKVNKDVDDLKKKDIDSVSTKKTSNSKSNSPNKRVNKNTSKK